MQQKSKSYIGWKPAYIKYTTNLTHQARAGLLDPVAARQKEIDNVIEVLCRRTKSNPLIYGESGTGKTAVVEGLAQKIIQNDVPESFRDKEILMLNFDTLIAGSYKKGELETRFQELILDLLSNQNNILFIDDIQAVLDYSNNQNLDLISVLKPHLDHGQLSLIAAASLSDYRNLFEKNSNLERNFQPVLINEPDDKSAVEMLQVLRPKYEKFHSVRITDKVLKDVISLSKRYVPERFLPDSAIDLIDEAASAIKIECESGKRKSDQMKKSDIENVISKSTGIPVTKLTRDESEKMLLLENLIHKKFVDQEDAVTAVSEAVRRGRVGISSQTRPVASFIFLGTGGTGKTELVKVLGEIVYGDNDAVITLDMSEYMEKHNISKLTGAPPGYVGYEEGGILTEAIRKKPHSILLFDNVDKAHPAILMILLQILEEGHLTDNKGNNISFKNTIIICTTNLGSGKILQGMKALGPQAKKEDIDTLFKELKQNIKKELVSFFSPEVLNRFDEIVLFRPLLPGDMREIVKLNIAKTALQLREQGFNFQITDQALDVLANLGYDPDFGARSVRGIIREVIENPVARTLIAKKFELGDIILIDHKPGQGFSISGNAAEILRNINVILPRIQDIAMIDRVTRENNKYKLNKIEGLGEFLKKIANPELVHDPAERNKFMNLQNKLLEEKKYGNPMANAVISALSSIKDGVNVKNDRNAGLPLANEIQLVTDDDYEDVKKIWEDNYLDLQFGQFSPWEQIERIKKDIEQTQNAISLFNSKNVENEDALQLVSNILPFILIGGFTKEEIIEYLKIKIKAAQSSLDKLTEEEETTITVSKILPKHEELSLHAI